MCADEQHAFTDISRQCFKWGERRPRARGRARSSAFELDLEFVVRIFGIAWCIDTASIPHIRLATSMKRCPLVRWSQREDTVLLRIEIQVTDRDS